MMVCIPNEINLNPLKGVKKRKNFTEINQFNVIFNSLYCILFYFDTLSY